MPQTFLSWTWLVLFVAISVVRKAHERRAGRRSSLRDTPVIEAALMVAWGIAAGVAPLVYMFTDRLAFADYPMPWPLGALGAALFLGAIWLLHRSHADLGAAWHPTVEPGAGQGLVTHGVFRRIRHPMYTAHLVWGVAQILLIPNLVGGALALPLILLVLLFRIPREERAMIAEFGDAYRAYMAQTGRVFPPLRLDGGSDGVGHSPQR